MESAVKKSPVRLPLLVTIPVKRKIKKSSRGASTVPNAEKKLSQIWGEQNVLGLFPRVEKKRISKVYLVQNRRGSKINDTKSRIEKVENAPYASEILKVTPFIETARIRRELKSRTRKICKSARKK